LEQQATGDGSVEADHGGVELAGEVDVCRVEAVGLCQLVGQAPEVVPQVEVRQVLGAVQDIMHESHGLDALLAVREQCQQARVVEGIGLEAEQAGNDLQVVLHTVVDLSEEYLLFAQRRLQLGVERLQRRRTLGDALFQFLLGALERLLGLAALGDVVHDGVQETPAAKFEGARVHLDVPDGAGGQPVAESVTT
jgi:hypothetical protein